ncbi:hypothetical protein I4F81_003729 [Pyropia yezoensis]|uniref:Uncharacterized protein n=1 Tax=Pyropia yezoensis TaxID=2788 RepID=A0ACC3BTE4_PYRYE|nr:hypothetical protein I4F81_003729 [Neopyropia yezoensis]
MQQARARRCSCLVSSDLCDARKSAKTQRFYSLLHVTVLTGARQPTFALHLNSAPRSTLYSARVPVSPHQQCSLQRQTSQRRGTADPEPCPTSAVQRHVEVRREDGHQSRNHHPGRRQLRLRRSASSDDDSHSERYTGHQHDDARHSHHQRRSRDGRRDHSDIEGHERGCEVGGATHGHEHAQEHAETCLDPRLALPDRSSHHSCHDRKQQKGRAPNKHQQAEKDAAPGC